MQWSAATIFGQSQVSINMGKYKPMVLKYPKRIIRGTSYSRKFIAFLKQRICIDSKATPHSTISLTKCRVSQTMLPYLRDGTGIAIRHPITKSLRQHGKGYLYRHPAVIAI